MKLVNTHTNMEQQNHDSSSAISVMIGFITALGNHMFGWLNKIHFTADWNAYLQAAIISFVGATIGFFTQLIWKKLTGKKKSKEEEI